MFKKNNNIMQLKQILVDKQVWCPITKELLDYRRGEVIQSGCRKLFISINGLETICKRLESEGRHADELLDYIVRVA